MLSAKENERTPFNINSSNHVKKKKEELHCVYKLIDVKKYIVLEKYLVFSELKNKNA
jgi:hypothetical protein